MGQGPLETMSKTPHYLTSLAEKLGRSGLPGFDDIATHWGWDKEKWLDVLLPKMQGAAGDYIFDELSREEWANYKELIKCLKRCFCKVESTKTYAAIFWKCDQKVSETEKTYVAELKWVYGKAYPQQDSASRDEDCLHRFLNGLIDQKVHQQVEFVKDPANIDEALVEIVKYHESQQSSQLQQDGSNKAFKAWAAHVNDIPSSDGELDSDEEGGKPNWVAHTNLTFSRQSWGNGQPSNVDQPPRPKEPQNGPAPIRAPADPIAQMKNIVAAETERCLNHMRELLAKQGPTIDGKNKVANQSGQTQNGNHNNPHSRWGQGRQNILGQVQCYRITWPPFSRQGYPLYQ